MTRICILENHRGSTSPRLTHWLADQNVAVDLRFGGDNYPGDITDYDGIILPGGGGTAWDNTMYPWIKWEYGLIKEAYDRRLPLLGICLGAQEIAYSLGGTVKHQVRPAQRGMTIIHATNQLPNDRLLGGLSTEFPMVESHEDTITELPKEAVKLAWSSGSPNEAFRIGSCMWGVQFHPEVSVESIKSNWTTGLHRQYLECCGVDIPELIRRAEPYDEENRIAARILIGNFAHICHEYHASLH